MKMRRRYFLAAAFLASATFAAALPAAAQQTLINVSYDPTREFYREYNAAFIKHWADEGKGSVNVQVTHGGSGSQARTVIDGLKADVVTLALGADIDAITNAGLLKEDWQGALPDDNNPYTSTIVFLVRKGNPKGLQDWDDLVKEGVQVITPNPKTSGGARWNLLAAWGWAQKEYSGDEAKTKDFVSKLYKNVPVLDSGARGSTTTFVQRGIGDVLLAWENEAFLAVEELGPDAFDIVVPKFSIRADPPVAIVDKSVDEKGTREVAQAYLDYLYSEEGQTLAAKHFYRPSEPEKVVDKALLERFPELELTTIAEFGGWKEAQPKFFGNGGIFDQIYAPGR